MKNSFFICLFTFLLLSCNSENIESNEQNAIDSENYSRFALCPQGYHMEWELIETPVRLFKKSGCKSGFGFCFQVGMIWSFDCVRNTSISQRVTYNALKNQVNTVAVENPENKTIKFYFHRDIVNSPDNLPTDFNTFDVEDKVSISEGYKLVGGEYPRVVEGDYYTYTVPYTR